MTKNLFVLFLLLCFGKSAFAQTDSLHQAEKPTLQVSGFLDVFYAYDFNRPHNNFRQPFLYNHNRHNEFNLNFGYLKVALEHSKYRANLALQTGTYANDNYAQEPDLLKNIFEANVGISLNPKNNLWLDAGIFASHIGFESAISADNLTLTRSLLAENSPYFLSGAKLTYTPNEKWTLVALVVNGWQRIQRPQGNSMPSFGTQINYKPSDKIDFNWSTFLGTDDPDTTRRVRYFNNLYGQFQLSEKFALIAGFDIGMQQESKGSNSYDIWLSPVVIGQYQINEKWKTALRAEYYQDRTGIIISTSTPNGFQTTGFSWNFDYLPNANVICRVEGRLLNSIDQIFQIENTIQTKNNFIIATSIAIRLDK